MSPAPISISGQIIDPVNRRIFPGHIHIQNGIIAEIREDHGVQENHFILPPLIDSHIHIESSMLTPAEFARQAASHGTGAVVADPHEIANVLGVPGIDFMIKNAQATPLSFYFGAPSCVPATPFESGGAVIDADTIATLLRRRDIYFLGEMMNFPGVIHRDGEVMAKIRHALNQGKPIDGHAPHLHGQDLSTYINAGISTDHETTSIEEARVKIENGMKILIREGSSAKNFEQLHPLISSHPQAGMFCSDDLHPEDLLRGHINLLVQRSLAKGHDILDILQYGCVNPVRHYNLATGLLQQGDSADFIITDSLEHFHIKAHYGQGLKIAEEGRPLFTAPRPQAVNHFMAQPIEPDDLQLVAQQGVIQVIGVEDGEIITSKSKRAPVVDKGYCIACPDQDLLKICVINRYKKTPPAIGFVSGFGLKTGAIASSIAHDSHNIIGVGCDDESLLLAINEVIGCTGGIAYATKNEMDCLPLPIAGLMSQQGCADTATQHRHLEQRVKTQGCHLSAPFMTMSFLALPVIPHLKITDQGLFDVDSFSFTPLFQDSTEDSP